MHGQALMAVEFKEQWALGGKNNNWRGKGRSVVAVVGFGPATRESQSANSLANETSGNE